MDHIESNYSPAPSASGDDATPSKRKVSTSKRARLTRDSRARVIAQLMRWRARIPGWDVDALRTLTSTEADGVAMVSAVLPAIGDERLRKLVQQHLADEQRRDDQAWAGDPEAKRDASHRPEDAGQDAVEEAAIQGFAVGPGCQPGPCRKEHPRHHMKEKATHNPRNDGSAL